MIKHALLLATLILFQAPAAQAQDPLHGLAMHGAPKYAADYKHLDYINPNAPKGGTFRQSVIGTFDSLNPFIVKGVPATGMGTIYQTLL
jgi:microcin C transport system substrate-binding protein